MHFRGGIFLFLALTYSFFAVVYAQTANDPLRFSVSRFVVTGDNPIGDKASKILQPYIGEHSGLEGLSAAADELERVIIDAGFGFHRVNLPPQPLTSGSIELNIVSFSIGKVTILGNEHFDRKNIENSVPQLRPGARPNTSELSRSLKIANNHASKDVTLRFKESEEIDAIDAELTVKDKNPQIFFLTLDNTGSEDSEEIRSTLGYQYGNLFNKDHALTATLTVAPEDPDATTQIGINYHVPLYGHGANLDFLFSDSEINTGLVGSSIELTGKGSVFGATYSRPMLTDTNFNHRWSIGFQSKLFENETNAGSLTTQSDVQSVPLELGYGFTYRTKTGAISGGLLYSMNIDAGSKNTDENYDAVRPDADNAWSTIRYNLAYDRVFAANWLFHGGLSGQLSDDLLISGEQFGVGGSTSLRGFEERSVTGDKGNQLSLEIWTPPYSSARFRLFIDLARVELNNGDSFNLSSSGLGLSWSWKRHLSVSVDYGLIIEGGGADTSINQDGDDRAHFNLVYRF